MKVLRANIYFQLPPDFEGTFRDALRAFVLHMEAQIELPPAMQDQNFNVTSFSFDQNLRYGFKAVAETGVWEMTSERTWQRIDEDPRCAHVKGASWIK